MRVGRFKIKLTLKKKIMATFLTVMIGALLAIPWLKYRLEDSLTKAFDKEIIKEHHLLFKDLISSEVERLFFWIKPWMNQGNLAPLLRQPIDREEWRRNVISLVNIMEMQFGVTSIMTFNVRGDLLTTHRQTGANEIDYTHPRIVTVLKKAMEFESITSGIVVDQVGAPYLALVIPSENRFDSVVHYHVVTMNFSEILKHYSKRVGQDVILHFNDMVIPSIDRDYSYDLKELKDHFEHRGRNYTRRNIHLNLSEYAFPSDNISLSLLVDTSEMHSVFVQNNIIYVISSIISLVLIVLILNFSISRFLVPLAEIMRVVRRVSEGDLNARAKTFGEDEMTLVSHAINIMLEHIERRDQETTELLDELKNYKAQTINAEKLSTLGQMTGAVVHELKNPLAVMKMSNDMLIRTLNKESGVYPEFVEKVKKKSEGIELGIKRIERIIKSVLSFARDGREDPFTPTPLLEIFDDVIELCSKKIKNSGVDFNVNLSCEGVRIECRSVQIVQVLVNLLNNGLDAVLELPEPRWIKMECRCRCSDTVASESCKKIEILVTDSGTGIPLDKQERMLKPFYTSKGIGKGTGLGLSISRDIVEIHQGRFYVDNSSPNTRFVVELPLKHKEVKGAVSSEKELLQILDDNSSAK